MLIALSQHQQACLFFNMFPHFTCKSCNVYHVNSLLLLPFVNSKQGGSLEGNSSSFEFKYKVQARHNVASRNTPSLSFWFGSQVVFVTYGIWYLYCISVFCDFFITVA